MQQLLSEAIEDFLAFRRSQDIGKGTIKQDRSTMTRFLTTVGNIYVHSVGERHVTKFFTDAARTRQAGALRNDHSTLAVFFEWARQTRRTKPDSNPLAGRRRPRRTDKERNRLHVSRFPALLDAAGDVDPRNRMLVAILLYLLPRDQEAADIRIRDVDLDAGYVTLRVFKKSPNSPPEDRMPISAELEVELRLWLRTYAEAVGELRPHHYLIPRRVPIGVRERDDGGHIIAHDFEYRPDLPFATGGKVVKAALGAIGFPVKDAEGKSLGEGSHTLRRSGARALFDRLVETGYDHALRIVQSMLHHETIVQTERYIGITADRRSRDDLLRGKPMYDIGGENVVKLVRSMES